MSPQIAHVLLAAIVALSILLMLLRPRGVTEVYWVGGGAVLLLALRLIPLPLAGKAIAEGSDVYLFLIGMMLLSELARENGVFDWLSSVAVRGAHGSTARLFTLIYGIGTLVTVFMSNDATAVVLTPAILSAVRKAKAEPKPHLFACALIANAASFVLPISNPANLVVFHTGMPPLGQWLLSFGLPSLLSIAATYTVMRVVFRADLRQPIENEPDAEPLKTEGKLVLIGLALMIAVLLAASTMKKDLGLPTCLAALAITAVVSIKSRSNPLKLAKNISWSTLALVAGLFILVDAVESIGALNLSQAALRWAQHLPQAVGALVTGGVVAVANNVVNNLPLGLVAGATVQAAHVKGLLANAVLIGVDLGPNLSVTGSLATILWLLALRKEEIEVGFWDFLKVGAIAMPVALLASLGGAILMKLFVPTLIPFQEKTMSAGWIIPFIIVGGALQACGAAMNGQLFKFVPNAWLASAISFALITFFFTGAFLIMPHPLPTTKNLAELPWWAVVGGLVGAVQVYAGLNFVNKVGAGPFMGFTVTASLIASLAIDHFGWFRMDHHPINGWRVLGGALLIGGVTLIAKF